MRRLAAASLVVAAVAAGCGTLLSVDGESVDGAHDAGYRTLADGAIIGPHGEVIIGDGATTGGEAGVDGDSGPMDGATPATCVRMSPCTGAPVASNSFTSLGGSGWTPYPNRVPTIDTSSGNFISSPSSMRTEIGAEAAGNAGSVSWLRNSVAGNAATACAEACIKLDVPSAFPPGVPGAVAFLRIENIGTGAQTQNVELRVGPTDDVHTEDTATAIFGGFPRGTWFFAKLELDYAGTTFKLFVDGAPKASALLHARPSNPIATDVYLGVLASGTHPQVVVHHDDFVLTKP